MNFTSALIVFGMVSAACFASGFVGYNIGYQRAEAKFEKAESRLQQELFDVSDSLSQASLELEETKEDAAAIILRLEQEALNDPDASNRVPSAASLQRLKDRWRAARGTDAGEH